MHRFYISSQDISQDVSKDKIIISDLQQIHHIKDVLRLNPGDKIVMFDSKGNEYTGLITQISSKDVSIGVKVKKSIPQHSGIKITLACAIPKGRRMDEVVDKLTQLGIQRFVPLQAERVVIDWDDEKRYRRLRRWEEIALNAAQQSGRAELLVIESVKNLVEVLSSKDEYDLKLIATLSGQRQILKELIAKSKPKNILILIGPEGDFTGREVRLARKAGCIPVSLGKLVLRVETAAVAIVSFIKLYIGSSIK